MKKYFYGVITMFSILLITIFLGCYQNPDFSPKSEMGFVVKLPSITNKKTIYYTQDDVSYYKLILKMEDKEIDSKTGKPGEILKFVVNEEGLYSFYIAAYDSNDVTIAEGFASQKISLIDGMVNVRLTLYPKIKEIDVNIEIEWNEDTINYASEGIVIGEKLFSKTSEIYVIPKESGNKTVIGKNSSGPFVEGRKVVLSPYVMGQYEVTQELFEVIMGVNPSKNKSTSETENINLRPVDSANWYQVIAFCNKLSILQNLEPVYSVDGITDWENLPFESIPTNSDSAWNYVAIDLSKNGYRLPTEAEWEYAARGGDVESSYWDTLFAGGNGASLLAWTYENSDYKSHEVGLKKPNSLGLYDLSGNVWEWCNDLYAYDMEISDNEVINPINSGLGNYRVQRGGCWKDSEYFSVLSYRRDDSCGGGVSSFWSDWGFRLCRSLTNIGTLDDTVYVNSNYVSRDPETYLDNGDIIGDFSVAWSENEDGTGEYVYIEEGIPLVSDGNREYSATFYYDCRMNGWNPSIENLDTDDGTYICEFKIRPNSTWDMTDIGYSHEKLVVNGEEVLCETYDGAGNNLFIYGMEDGMTYTVKIRVTDSCDVYVKVIKHL